MRGRVIETLIDLTGINPNVLAVILGNGDEVYVQGLKKEQKKAGVENRVLFKPAVSATKLWKYVRAVDVGMILAPATCLNHLYSLPNKFFENIQSETPIICPHYPAMKEIVDKYHNGLCCDLERLEDINQCVEQLRLDQHYIRNARKNATTAKHDLCWENEKDSAGGSSGRDLTIHYQTDRI